MTIKSGAPFLVLRAGEGPAPYVMRGAPQRRMRALLISIRERRSGLVFHFIHKFIYAVALVLILIIGNARAEGSFTGVAWPSQHMSGFGSIEEAAAWACASSIPPLHNSYDIYCDGSTKVYPPLVLPPKIYGWLRIYTAYYYRNGEYAAGGAIGYNLTTPMTKNVDGCGIGNPISASIGCKITEPQFDIGDASTGLSYVRVYASVSTPVRRRNGANWHGTYSK
ncbi:MAG: hypothetical protein ACREO8_02780 [Luteimonas sp.]